MNCSRSPVSSTRARDSRFAAIESARALGIPSRSEEPEFHRTGVFRAVRSAGIRQVPGRCAAA